MKEVGPDPLDRRSCGCWRVTEVAIKSNCLPYLYGASI